MSTLLYSTQQSPDEGLPENSSVDIHKKLPSSVDRVDSDDIVDSDDAVDSDDIVDSDDAVDSRYCWYGLTLRDSRWMYASEKVNNIIWSDLIMSEVCNII